MLEAVFSRRSSFRVTMATFLNALKFSCAFELQSWTSRGKCQAKKWTLTVSSQGRWYLGFLPPLVGTGRYFLRPFAKAKSTNYLMRRPLMWVAKQGLASTDLRGCTKKVDETILFVLLTCSSPRQIPPSHSIEQNYIGGKMYSISVV